MRVRAPATGLSTSALRELQERWLAPLEDVEPIPVMLDLAIGDLRVLLTEVVNLNDTVDRLVKLTPIPAGTPCPCCGVVAG